MVGRVCVFGWGGARGLSGARAGRGAVAHPCLGSFVWGGAAAEVTSDWLKVKMGL